MGEAADIGAGVLSAARPIGADPSLSVGYPALFALLERYSVRATFFIEGWNGVHHPEAVAEIVERGHELGMHGWLHERWSELPPSEERELAQRATEALEDASGTRPRGFRAPGGSRSGHTEEILYELGYLYDASLGDGMQPRRLARDLVQVPFVWPGVDGFYYLRDEQVDPKIVADRWKEALRKSVERRGLFVLICHAFLTGIDPARLAALEEVIAAALGDENVEVCTAGEVAELVLAERWLTGGVDVAR
jgi:peptidoglycan/xylan/chitin deacetylase (PgdA/CDA1 family)